MLETPNINDSRPRDRGHVRLVITLVMCMAAVVTARQSPGGPAAGQPPASSQATFRSAANYIRVDLYAKANGMAVIDLKPQDLELREGNRISAWA